MLEEKIKKYVNDQWFYASNKMACDLNLTTEYNLRNWINVLKKTHIMMLRILLKKNV